LPPFKTASRISARIRRVHSPHAEGVHHFRPVHWRSRLSTIVAELYDALRKAGVEEQLARDAARAVLGAEARAGSPRKPTSLN
jgi:hypothetical protein